MEYLAQLPFRKGDIETRAIDVGEIVLIADENKNKMNWPLNIHANPSTRYELRKLIPQKVVELISAQDTINQKQLIGQKEMTK